MTQNHAIFDGGIAALAHDVDGGTAVHGVIIGEGDVTLGISGKRVRWPAGILREVADLLEGKPITMADSLDPEQHVGVEKTDDGARITGNVSMDEKVGEILEGAYEEGVGVIFEGFLADWEAEEAVESGLAQTSPVLILDDYEVVEEATDDEPALYEPTGVRAFRDLAIVADGAAPSNEINVGPADAFPAATAEALSSHFGADVPTEGEVGDAGEPADGAADTDSGAGDDGPTDTQGQSTPASGWRQHMSDDDLTDKERELLAVAGQKDDPTVVEAEVLERLDALETIEEAHEENKELLEAAESLDDPTVQSEEQVAAMQERLDIMEDMMAEALTERKGLKEATVEAMSFEAKASEFTDDESGEFNVEALTQSPEAGSPPTGNGGDGPTEEDIERIEEIDTKLGLAGTALPRERVEALQAEACELADVDDYDAAVEVL